MEHYFHPLVVPALLDRVDSLCMFPQKDVLRAFPWHKVDNSSVLDPERIETALRNSDLIYAETHENMLSEGITCDSPT